MGCTGCADANLIAIRMKIGAEDVVFRRCNRCEINQWATTEGEISLDEVLELARAGKFVVRLKGGDPFVFGRGGEELEALKASGVDFEVAPGITAALACAAYAGIPLTHRDHAQSLRLVSAHLRDPDKSMDWPALAKERQTLAVYMGVAALHEFRDRLIEHGRDPNTPFALIENGSRPHLTNATRQLLAEFFKVHPGYLAKRGESLEGLLALMEREGFVAYLIEEEYWGPAQIEQVRRIGPPRRLGTEPVVDGTALIFSRLRQDTLA